MSLIASNITHLISTQESTWKELRKKEQFDGLDYKWALAICEPTINELIEIANHFGVSIDDLIKRDIAQKCIDKELFTISQN